MFFPIVVEDRYYLVLFNFRKSVVGFVDGIKATDENCASTDLVVDVLVSTCHIYSIPNAFLYQ